jgi:predicted Rdx family selenoprotein
VFAPGGGFADLRSRAKPSAGLAQVLLATFAEDLGEVALIPGTGGVFVVEREGACLSGSGSATAAFPMPGRSSGGSAT